MSESSKGKFSKRVKEELYEVIPGPRHCRIAEIAVIAALMESKQPDALLAKKFFTLLDKTINISKCISWDSLLESVELRRLLKTANRNGYCPVSGLFLQQECCRKAFLRGAFLAAGTVSDPNKAYHLEIATGDEKLANQLMDVINGFGISSRLSKRKSNYVVYVKEGASLAEILGIMGAPLSLMEFENIRILKDIRNDLNRKVNCEAANIKKTISAAMGQINDIEFIDKVCGINELPGGLYEIAMLRRSYPEASLEELGMMLTPAVGKSGVNHRLRRISQFAEDLRREGYIDEQRDYS